MRANDLVLELLRMSQSHIDDATDPDTPEALFKPYLRIGAVAGQAALLLLVSWVGERLNTWKELCQDCGLPFEDSPGVRDTRHDHCGPLPHTGPVGGPYCEKCA